ncbi:calcium/proton exchanger [Hymenopellis radicata]|nr:calcium/proton exchanger [Hymenopellis radicata]
MTVPSRELFVLSSVLHILGRLNFKNEDMAIRITYRAALPHFTDNSSVSPSSLESGATEQRPLVENPQHVTTAAEPLTSTQTNDIRPRRAATGDSHRRNSARSARQSFGPLERVRTTLLSQMTPVKPVAPAPSAWQSSLSILRSSLSVRTPPLRLKSLIDIFSHVQWALHFALAGKQDTLIFVFSFLAIIPLAKLLAFATDELSMRVGQTLAGLLNATLSESNITQIIALIKCELQIVQSSLVGSILSNLLLVLGMCFFAGGIKFQEQGFGLVATQLNSSLLTISVIAVLLPQRSTSRWILIPITTRLPTFFMSVTELPSFFSSAVYLSYLVFQLFSHTVLYSDKGEHVMKSTQYERQFRNPLSRKGKAEESTIHDEPDEAEPSSTQTHIEDEEETPQLSVGMTIGLLVVVTVLVAVTAEWLVDSIDGMTNKGGISKEFVGVILLPIVGNAAEHLTAVTVSVKDKLNLSLGVAVGSSIQIALFVIPFIVTLAWIMGKPLTLLFDPYESVALFLAVLTVNYVVQDGLYVILGVTFWFYPGVDTSTFLNVTCST